MRFRLIEHGLVDSTSERAFAALAAGRAEHGDVHVARGQSAGRGRLGRRWESPAGEGLYMSVVLLPAPPPFAAPALTMAAVLAAKAGLEHVGLAPERLRVKWPNDIEVAGAKICGSLIESRGLERERPHYVLGLGLNVRQRAFPTELLAERAATSLALEGVACEPRTVARAVLAELPVRLEQARGDHATLARDFLQACGLGDRTVRIEARGASRRGTLLGLSIAEGIELELETGERELLPLESVSAVGIE